MCSSLASVNVCQPFTGIQHICPRYIFSYSCICPIYINIVAILLAVKAGFCMFLFLDFNRKGNFKYEFKTSTFCLVWLGYSAVICGIWFLRLFFFKCTFWLSSSVLPCSSHSPCICKSLTFLSWLQHSGRPKQQFVVSFG